MLKGIFYNMGPLNIYAFFCSCNCFVMKLIRHPGKLGTSSIKVLIITPQAPLSATCIRCSPEMVDGSRPVVFVVWREVEGGGALIFAAAQASLDDDGDKVLIQSLCSPPASPYLAMKHTSHTAE